MSCARSSTPQLQDDLLGMEQVFESVFKLFLNQWVFETLNYSLQGSAKRRGLGCVNSPPGSAWL